jgi:DNA modification methylase
MLKEEIKTLKVVYLPIGRIKKYEGNPKIHSPKQIAQIKKSVEEFGFINPVLIGNDNELIAGHGRLEAAKMAGLKEIPAIHLGHLTEAQKKAYLIVDNKLTELGEWSTEKLKLEFQAIESLSPEISLDITGFEMPQIEGIMEGISKEADPVINAIPFIPEDEIVAKKGDLWQLGRHYIICGDSLKRETFTTLMGDKKADMVFADPPYDVKINGHVCGKGTCKHKEFAMASGEMSSSEFQNFLKQSFTLLKEFSKDGSLHFLCMDWRHIKEIILAGEVYTEFKNLCVWVKNNAGMGSLYRSQHELIFVFKNGKAPHVNNVELGKNGRYRSNIWSYNGVNSFGKERENLKIHPTSKPVEMIKDAILDVTNKGAIVLDNFLGSGSTLIAAEKVKRICYGIEIEPLYVDTTIRRYEKLTGKDAVHLKSGKTYKELLNTKKEEK